MIIRRLINPTEPGARPPLGYAVAFQVSPEISVCYPILFHIFVRRIHQSIIELSKPTVDKQEGTSTASLSEAYNNGVAEGERHNRASVQAIRDEEWRKGVTFGYERGINETRGKMAEVIADEVKKAMDKEVLAGRWWTLPPGQS